jgi:hypothetical protein
VQTVGGTVRTVGTTVHDATSLIDAVAHPERLSGTTAEVVGDLGSVVGSAGEVVGSTGAVIGGAGTTVHTIGDPNGATGELTGTIGDLLGSGGSVVGAVGDSLGTVGDGIGSTGDDLGDGVGSIGDGLGDLGDGVGGVVGGVVGGGDDVGPGGNGGSGGLPGGILPSGASSTSGSRADSAVDTIGAITVAGHAGTDSAVDADRPASLADRTGNAGTGALILLQPAAGAQQQSGPAAHQGLGSDGTQATGAGFLGGPLGPGSDRHGAADILDDLAAGTASFGGAGHPVAATLSAQVNLCSGGPAAAFGNTAPAPRGHTFDPGFSPD